MQRHTLLGFCGGGVYLAIIRRGLAASKSARRLLRAKTLQRG